MAFDALIKDFGRLSMSVRICPYAARAVPSTMSTKITPSAPTRSDTLAAIAPPMLQE